MALELIQRLLDDPDPAFACYAIGDREKKEGRVEPLAHFANPPAPPALLERIPSVPGAEQLSEVLARYNGLLLYTARETESEGVEIFPIDEWDHRTAQTVEAWREEQDINPVDDPPYGFDDFIAVAHSRGASNYIHWVTRGPRAGSIYWWPWTMMPHQDTPPVADDFQGFIRLLYERPAYFFNEVLLCYTRFSDVRSLTEWVPGRYLPDRQNSSVGR